MNQWVIVLIVLLVLLFFIGIVFYEISVWKECLQTNSWWYCLRIIGK